LDFLFFSGKKTTNDASEIKKTRFAVKKRVKRKKTRSMIEGENLVFFISPIFHSDENPSATRQQ